MSCLGGGEIRSVPGVACRARAMAAIALADDDRESATEVLRWLVEEWWRGDVVGARVPRVAVALLEDALQHGRQSIAVTAPVERRGEVDLQREGVGIALDRLGQRLGGAGVGLPRFVLRVA